MTTDVDGNEIGRLFVGGLPQTTNKTSLASYFSNFGEVEDAVVMMDHRTGRSRGFGYVKFKDVNAVALVMQSKPHIIDSKEIDAKQCNIHMRGKNRRSSKIFVGGISPEHDAEMIRKCFEQYGAVTDVNLMLDHTKQKHRGFAFVGFQDESVVKLLIAMHYITIGGKQVEIKEMEPPHYAESSKTNLDSQQRVASPSKAMLGASKANCHGDHLMGGPFGSPWRSVLPMAQPPPWGMAYPTAWGPPQPPGVNASSAAWAQWPPAYVGIQAYPTPPGAMAYCECVPWMAAPPWGPTPDAMPPAMSPWYSAPPSSVMPNGLYLSPWSTSPTTNSPLPPQDSPHSLNTSPSSTALSRPQQAPCSPPNTLNMQHSSLFGHASFWETPQSMGYAPWTSQATLSSSNGASGINTSCDMTPTSSGSSKPQQDGILSSSDGSGDSSKGKYNFSHGNLDVTRMSCGSELMMLDDPTNSLIYGNPKDMLYVPLLSGGQMEESSSNVIHQQPDGDYSRPTSSLTSLYQQSPHSSPMFVRR